VTIFHNSEVVESPLNFLDPRETFRIGPNNEERSSEIAQKANGESYSITFRKSLYASKYGNATVLVGHHSNHGQVAVKVLRLKHKSHRKGIPKLVEEWAREVRALRLLRHPSIIRVIDFDARVPSIYMEYLPWKDLAGWLAADGMSFSGTRRDAQRVLKDMSSALQHLSSHGIIHNDITPGNILYHRDHGAVLIDFGMAEFGRARYPGGTAWYICPEYIRTRTRGSESDVYALGVTMMYLLRTINLPELTRPAWNFCQGVEHPESREARTNREWLHYIQYNRGRLQGLGIDRVVYYMLDDSASQRITVRNLERATRGLS
jgi:serine/threonine protein kinase